MPGQDSQGYTENSAQVARKRKRALPGGMLTDPGRTAVVYIFRCGEYRKVGITKDLRKRHADLQFGNPYPIHVELYRTVSAYFVRHIEKAAHERLAAHRHTGEWFLVDRAAAKAAVVEACKEVAKLERQQWRRAAENREKFRETALPEPSAGA